MLKRKMVNGKLAFVLYGDVLMDQLWYLTCEYGACASKATPVYFNGTKKENLVQDIWAYRPEPLKNGYCKYMLFVNKKLEAQSRSLIEIWRHFRKWRIYTDDCHIVNRETGMTYSQPRGLWTKNWVVRRLNS